MSDALHIWMSGFGRSTVHDSLYNKLLGSLLYRAVHATCHHTVLCDVRAPMAVWHVTQTISAILTLQGLGYPPLCPHLTAVAAASWTPGQHYQHHWRPVAAAAALTSAQVWLQSSAAALLAAAAAASMHHPDPVPHRNHHPHRFQTGIFSHRFLHQDLHQCRYHASQAITNTHHSPSHVGEVQLPFVNGTLPRLTST